MIIALSGGVGGAKLSFGLSQVVASDDLKIIVNTGDDFEHMGLHVSPDIDTVCYTLARIANPKTGWGLEDETWNFMQATERLGGPTWFQLGDQDLATHVLRTERLRLGHRLSDITRDFAFAIRPNDGHFALGDSCRFDCSTRAGFVDGRLA
jgi:LPPG:FO 2-phospho-L-lactate transferase